MQTITIEGIVRKDLGKKATKALRKNQQVPCELYGGEENIHFAATPKSLKGLIYTPDFHTATIDIDGKQHVAIIKDIQFHPVTDAVLHVDFQELIPGRMVQTEVPLRTVGVPEGVQTGGKLMMKVRRLKVKTTPENLIDKVEIDVSGLELGQSFKVRDIKDLGMQIMNPSGIPIASVEIPRVLRSADALEEGEVEGEEGEEGVEGEEASAEE